MSEKQCGKQPAGRPRTPPSNAQSQTARSQQSSLTPRTRREGGGAIPLPQPRVPIAELMQHEMLICSVETFLDHYAPFSPSSDVCLTKDGLGWESFEGIRPSDLDATESTVFKKLLETIEVLEGSDLNGCNPRRQVNFRYKDSPDSLVKGELIGSNTFKVDACLRPNDADPQTIYSAEAAVIAEYKLRTRPNDVRQNRQQLVSAASHIMNDDPRRMWMYGITIGDDEMSVWYFSRSHSVKSKVFDWTKDIKTFVRIFISFIFATEKEMGFDPLVHRIQAQDKIQYVYEIDKRFFLTVEPIFNPRVLCISGRKTRVWRAVEVRGLSKKDLGTSLNNGKEYAIKDVWLDEGSDTEGAILQKIFTSLEAQTTTRKEGISQTLYEVLQDAIDGKHYRQYFMEIVCDTQGETTKPPAPDAVADPRILDTSPVEQTEEVNKSLRVSSRSNPKTPNHSGLSGSVLQRDGPPHTRDHQAKRQYRLIYNHVGIPLHDAPNLKSCFDALRDAFIALVLMSFAGWVHRDVSTGNIILLQGDGGRFRGKLSDLEYAKEYSGNPVGKKNPKTGTPYFMAYEVHSNDTIRAENPVVDLSSRDRSQILGMESPNMSTELWPSFYRYEYDVESLWWIMVWTPLTRIPYRPAQKLSREVFTYTSKPSDKRKQVFKSQHDPSIKNAMLPTLANLAHPISAMHRVLYASYLKVYASFDGYLNFYCYFWDILKDLLLSIQQGNISNLALSAPDLCLRDSSSQGPNASTAPATGEKRQHRDRDGVQEENAGGEDEASGSQKRPRIRLDNDMTG